MEKSDKQPDRIRVIVRKRTPLSSHDNLSNIYSDSDWTNIFENKIQINYDRLIISLKAGINGKL